MLKNCAIQDLPLPQQEQSRLSSRNGSHLYQSPGFMFLTYVTDLNQAPARQLTTISISRHICFPILPLARAVLSESAQSCLHCLLLAMSHRRHLLIFSIARHLHQCSDHHSYAGRVPVHRATIHCLIARLPTEWRLQQLSPSITAH